MEWAARAVGVFYMAAGLITLHQAVINWRLERICAALFPTSLNERAADIILTVGAVLVLISGISLVLLQDWAVEAFLAAWTLQAGYLLWAQRWYRPEDEELAKGRRQTLNAFALYTVVTGGVQWLDLIRILD